ncbi:MAG: DNA repair protein RecO [Erysipelotrichaceae bacterium]|nr:DNA repair protein RecO [Erysipelotrichaceae bacterium]
MNDTTEVMILKQTDYRERAALVTVLSKEYGKLTLSAEGVRKLTSKNAGALIPCTKASLTIDYSEGRTMFRLKGARTVKAYKNIHKDLILSAAAGVLSEIADQMTYTDHDIVSAVHTYTLLEEALDLLENGEKSDTVLALFLSTMMKNAGMSPNVDECVMCGRTNAAAISVRDGGFLCDRCAAQAGVPPRSVTELKRFRLISKAELKHYPIVKESTERTIEDLAILLEILNRHAGIEIRSFSLYQRVFH